MGGRGKCVGDGGGGRRKPVGKQWWGGGGQGREDKGVRRKSGGGIGDDEGDFRETDLSGRSGTSSKFRASGGGIRRWKPCFCDAGPCALSIAHAGTDRATTSFGLGQSASEIEGCAQTCCASFARMTGNHRLFSCCSTLERGHPLPKTAHQVVSLASTLSICPVREAVRYKNSAKSAMVPLLSAFLALHQRSKSGPVTI